MNAVSVSIQDVSVFGGERCVSDFFDDDVSLYYIGGIIKHARALNAFAARFRPPLSGTLVASAVAASP